MMTLGRDSRPWATGAATPCQNPSRTPKAAMNRDHLWEGTGMRSPDLLGTTEGGISTRYRSDQIVKCVSSCHLVYHDASELEVSCRAFASNFPLTGLAAEPLKEMLPQESWRNCAHETCLADRCPKRQDRLRPPEIPPFAPDASADLPFLSVRICEDLWENILFGQCHVQFNCKEERN